MPAQEQTELTCVSCDTTFEPAPNGGFCPDCDTPHPDYDMQSTDDEDESAADVEAADDSVAEVDDGDESAEAECGSCGSTVDASAAFCPECGSELGAESDDEAEVEDADDSLDECPDCGTSIDDEVYCPSCGTHLEPIRAGEAPAASSEEATLVIAGESYTFGDGDTFGRQDADWLQDLVTAAGGRESATYVSGTHLEFSVEDDGVYVTDVSTNGTALNGTEMDGGTERLSDGDTLELAERVPIDVRL